MYPQRSVMTCGLATALEPPHFNHAPVWGATACATRSTSCPASFNPRTRVGCDVMPRVHLLAAITVSIHAPAWGATLPFLIHDSGTQFQSTHPRGVRLVKHLFPHLTPLGFNPRTRVGCDTLENQFRKDSGSFNPRTRVGCDGPQASGLLCPVPVSIHAPAWGATTTAADRLTSGTTFQSTHPRGVRRGKHYTRTIPGAVSIHAPAWGATPTIWAARPGKPGFNPRTRVGCDGYGAAACSRTRRFNPRTRVGCDVEAAAARRMRS